MVRLLDDHTKHMIFLKRRWSRYIRRVEEAWSRYHKSDRRKGRECDLSLDFVRSELAKPCTYCGDAEGFICLDRLNSELGHLMTNVVPACERCNLIKKDMPQLAWEKIAPSVRIARESGLFGDWVGGPHARLRKEPPPEPVYVRERNIYTYPSKAELESQLEVEPASIVAPRIGVSAKALRAHCARIGIVLHGLGHWQRVKAGKDPGLERSRFISSAPKNTEYPSPTDLSNLLQTKPATEIAKDLGVSSTALKKHCKRVGVETPPRGYWRAKEASETVKEDPRCKGCLTPITKASTTGQCSSCFNKSPEKREATRIQKTRFPTLPIDAERPRE